MVLDSGTPSYEQNPHVLGASPRCKGSGKKFSERNGLRLYSYLSPAPAPDSDSTGLGQTPKTLTKPKCPKASEARPEVKRLSGTCPTFSSPCSWMRRSESTRAVNSSGRARAQIRSAASLPHIAKPKAEEIGNVRKSPCLLVALRPLNIDTEREKFFQSCYTYNPQFEYEEPLPVAVLEKYKDASDQFITQAIRIIHTVLEKYGTYESFEVATGGRLLSKCQIWSIIRKYMQKEGCVGEVVVQLTDDLLSQAVMMVENSRPTLAINLSGARQYWLEGMLRHEIVFQGLQPKKFISEASLEAELGTHYIRGVNNAHQPWHSSEGRKQYGLKPANPTEEGLASLHSVLFRKQPFLWRAALLYYTIYQASHMSFCALFCDLEQYVQDARVRWEYCVRAKRGQTDTSQPGCFSKDQVYLDGILRILRHRQTIDFQLLAALGKVSYEDVNHLKKFGVLEKARIPHFMQDLGRYMKQLDHIIKTNRLNEKELEQLLPD
ncbi:microtubule-associated tyrosine carboxypeptidase 1 isoform X1 [Alligator mississippiensis]|uniref:microtubule-associated tyrosine carboxypeptidase 1 isoform X1 n=1 Tax=Alligator mississippiensis TaxID=8496 RepID=UPI0003D0A35C|nr:microtubule-associated tyrosine carboxypeptidase 1 isoform X1 [Alligator mississippiensis]XP_059569594.1 microtubule-associated tyrosine carboxypeptidase 1 isoform X1 [Alligator mississippiensis]